MTVDLLGHQSATREPQILNQHFLSVFREGGRLVTTVVLRADTNDVELLKVVQFSLVQFVV